MSTDTSSVAHARRSGSVSSSTGGSASGSGGGGTGGGGILANAHEAPKRSATQSGFRSALKAAFIPQQPGKQMKSGNKPLGKTFRRTEPLPQTHEGGEVLKVDPRGPNAPCGDGVVLSASPPGDSGDENGEQFVEGTSKGSVTESSQNGSSASDLLSPASAHRDRSATVSTQFSDASADSRGNPCRIKFAPLPTSGRLKRANSITIGVAARSQLLHSQGAGRNVNGNAQLWQQHQLQQQREQQQRRSERSSDSTAAGSRHSGIQPSQEQIDIGEEIRKGAIKAWDRVRRGSSASRASESSATAATPDEGAANTKGEQTPRGARTPIAELESEEEEGRRTPQRKSMQRRLSTGAFTGHASFSQIEERRKRGDLDEPEKENRRGRHNERDDERENDATRFIEMLGSTGAGKEAFHGARGPYRREGKAERQTRVVAQQNGDGSDAVESEEDDEEQREAQRMAAEALKGHSDKATKAAGVEKMETKRTTSLGLGRK